MTDLTRPQNISPALAAAFNAGDLDAMAALYEPQAVLIDETGAQHQGLAAIRAALAAMLADGGVLTSNPRIAVVAGDIALTGAAWQLIRDNARNVLAAGSSLEVLRRQPDGRWCYVLDCPAGPPIDAV